MRLRDEVADSDAAHSQLETASAARSLRSGVASFMHDRWRIGIVFGAGMLLTIGAALMAPTRYVAEAELLLRLGREYIYKPEVGEQLSGAAPVAYDREQTLLAEARIMTSRDIIDAVLDKMGIDQVFPELADSMPTRVLKDMAAPVLGSSAPQPPADPARPVDKRRAVAIQRFERSLEAELLKGSNLMQVSFTGRDPAVAAAVLTEVVDAYLTRRSVIFAGAIRGTAQANFDARRDQLQAADGKLAELKRDKGVQAFEAQQNLLLAQRNGLEERRAESMVARVRAKARAASLRGSLAGVTADVRLSSETQRSDAAEKARSLLLDLKLKERELRSQFHDDNPLVQDARADIAYTQEYLRSLVANPSSTVKMGRSPARDVVEPELLRTLADQDQADSATATLSEQLAVLDRRLATLASSEPGLHALERDRRLAEENFNAAAKALRDEMALAELDRERRSNVSIVQAPRVPVNGRSLAPAILAIGGFLSLCAALLTAFLCALWRDTFLTPEQAEEGLSVPMLAAVPESRS